MAEVGINSESYEETQPPAYVYRTLEFVFIYVSLVFVDKSFPLNGPPSPLLFSEEDFLGALK